MPPKEGGTATAPAEKKPAGKAPAKTAAKKTKKIKKTRRGFGKKPRRGFGKKWIYSSCIYKVLKQCHFWAGMSYNAMSIMNSFVNDIFERIAGEASKLMAYNKRSTMSCRDIQASVQLILPGRLAKDAVSEGILAVTSEETGAATKKTRTRKSKDAKDALTHATSTVSEVMAIRAARPDHVLFVQMGGFYELYEYCTPDLDILADALNLTVSSPPNTFRRAGFPLHQIERYVSRLASADGDLRRSVAIGKFSHALSPLPTTADSVADTNDNCFLLSLIAHSSTKANEPLRIGLSWTDINTGEFAVIDSSLGTLLSDLTRIAPAEIVSVKVQQRIYPIESLRGSLQNASLEESIKLTPNRVRYMNHDASEASVAAAGALFGYLNEIFCGFEPHFHFNSNTTGIIGRGISVELDNLRAKLESYDEQESTLKAMLTRQYGVEVILSEDAKEGPCVSVPSGKAGVNSEAFKIIRSDKLVEALRRQSLVTKHKFKHTKWTKLFDGRKMHSHY
ncbi:hypothetical protein CcCBS67573_g00500 [Chytriomyces confervae]|uniref:Histone H2A/H2B/H3 domain-containing protein n=1 Tax=Chytriomyces confervae TaxID=246404 RepID=A0A507FR99_9FUNG|nr:hypothetical protein CcCBS67573_g00500 [Chytriomyces confervae]